MHCGRSKNGRLQFPPTLPVHASQELEIITMLLTKQDVDMASNKEYYVDQSRVHRVLDYLPEAAIAS